DQPECGAPGVPALPRVRVELPRGCVRRLSAGPARRLPVTRVAGFRAPRRAAEQVRPLAVDAVVDRVLTQPERAVEPGLRLLGDEEIPLEQLPDDEAAAGLAEPAQPVVVPLELRVHVGDGVDAVAPGAVGPLAERVDALVADPAALHERLLEQEPAVQAGVN